MKACEIGICSKAISIFGYSKQACLSNAIIEEVDLKYVYPLLLLLAYGMAFSLVILLLEIIFMKFSIRKD